VPPYDDYESHKELCPKCSHTRKNQNQSERCLSVWDNGYTKCHNCGVEGFSDGRIVQPKKEYEKPSQELPDGLPEDVITYFEKRGIDYDVLMRNKISYNRASNEIMFPYFYNGEILNNKYRKFGEKRWRQETNARKSFYGTDDIIGETDIYIVEGEMDKLSFEMAGYLNVISVPDGAPMPEAKNVEGKFAFIEDWMPIFEFAERVIIAVDTDAPGQRLKQELIDRIGDDKCWTIDWPEDCKDANEVLVKHGNVKLMDSIGEIKPLPIEGVVWPNDILSNLVQLHRDGMPGGVKTGWPKFDQFYTVKPGEMTIITGIPAHGKSTWLNALMVNLATLHDWKFLLYSPENYPPERHLAALASVYTGKPFREGPTQRLSIDEVMKVGGWLQNHFCYLQPEDNGTQLKALLNSALSVAKRFKLDGFVLDPWNEIDSTRANGMTETEHISQCLTSVRMFARMNKIHVWIVAHPTKLHKELGSTEQPVATAYNISGSAHWANKADNVLTVFRDPGNEARPTEVHIQKIRFREVGKTGKQHFKFDYICDRFEDISDSGYTGQVAQEKPTFKETKYKPDGWKGLYDGST
jgi:twinkle protein